MTEPSLRSTCETCGAAPVKAFGWDGSLLCDRHYAEAQANVAAAERDAMSEPSLRSTDQQDVTRNPEIDVRNAIEAIGSLFPSVDDPSEYERGYGEAINDAIAAVARLVDLEAGGGGV